MSYEVFILSLIIFLHELGHFVAARWAGIRVLAFAVGRSEDPRVPLGYALATPVAMVVKIVMAQVLVLLL